MSAVPETSEVPCVDPSASYEVTTVKMFGFPGTDDNYAYILRDRDTHECLLVDPTVPSEVLKSWSSLSSEYESARITGVLCTHKHRDHTRGNAAIVKKFSTDEHTVPVYGGKADNVGSLGSDRFTVEFGDEDTDGPTPTITLGKRTVIEVIPAPSHTRGHLLFVAHSREEDGSLVHPSLFSGDTLFVAGVGNFNEERNNGGDMQNNFDRISAMKDECLVFPGHEYAASNVQFGLFIEPDNPHMKALEDRCKKHGGLAVPSTVGDERKHNIFMRTGIESVQKRVSSLVRDLTEQGTIDFSDRKFTFDKTSDFMMALRLLKDRKSLWRKRGAL